MCGMEPVNIREHQKEVKNPTALSCRGFSVSRQEACSHRSLAPAAHFYFRASGRTFSFPTY